MKFVSLSQLLGCPLFGSNTFLFPVPGFIVSLVRIKEKKKRKKEKEEEGRRKRYKGKERRNRTRKK